MKEIEFSGSVLDQMRLTKVGGYITYNSKGKPVFRFENEEQFNKYIELGKKREVTA